MVRFKSILAFARHIFAVLRKSYEILRRQKGLEKDFQRKKRLKIT
jgi:hypothetical protein